MPFKDKEVEIAYRRNRDRLSKEKLEKLKASTPCADCNQYFPHYVMDFDHVPERGEKKRCVSQYIGSRSVDTPSVASEIAKCDLVCANCHKIRTHIRGQQRKNIAT